MIATLMARPLKVRRDFRARAIVGIAHPAAGEIAEEPVTAAAAGESVNGGVVEDVPLRSGRMQDERAAGGRIQ